MTKQPNKTYIKVNNARYVISRHYVQRGNRRGNEIGHIRGKRILLSSCFFVGHHSYNDLRDKLYDVSGIYLALFYALSEQSVIFLGLQIVRFFPVVSHTSNVYVFWNVILSFMQQKYREPWEKSHLINFTQNKL